MHSADKHVAVRKQARICTTPWWARRLSARRRTNQVLNGTRHNSSNSIYSNIRSQLLDDTEIAQFGDPQKTLEDLGSTCWGWDKQPWAYRAPCLTRDHCVFVSPKSRLVKQVHFLQRWERSLSNNEVLALHPQSWQNFLEMMVRTYAIAHSKGGIMILHVWSCLFILWINQYELIKYS